MVFRRANAANMKEGRKAQIVCAACGAETLLLRRPVFEGLTKTGESLSCASCGHEYPTEADVPFKDDARPEVFFDADRSAEVKVFAEKETERLCRHCANYVVNPFVQWCALHKKEVEATDTCDRFEPRPPPKTL